MSTPGQEINKHFTHQSGRIILKFSRLEPGDEVFFKVKRNIQLKKVLNVYCNRQCLDIRITVLFYKGRHIRAEQTPDELEMEDGDEIFIVLRLTGGAAY